MLSAVLMLTAVAAHAQGLRYGIVAGLNVNQPRGNGEEKARVGMRVGVKGEYVLTDSPHSLYLTTSLLFSQKGNREELFVEPSLEEDEKITSAELKTNLGYIEMPLYVGYLRKGTGNIDFMLEGGPYLAYAPWGRSNLYINGEKRTGGDEINVFHQGGYRRFDAGLGLNLGAEILGHYRLSFGFQYGLTQNHHRFDVKETSYRDTDTYYNRTFTLSLGYMF